MLFNVLLRYFWRNYSSIVCFPPRWRGGKENFFVGALQAGAAPPAKPPYFFPLPNGACAVGEGAGGGEKLKAVNCKDSSIAALLVLLYLS